MVSQWAESKLDNTQNNFTFEDLVTPTISLLSLIRDGNPLSIEGVIVRDQEDNPLGFWLWQKVDDMAMSLARVSVGHLNGVSGSAEFAAVKMAQKLQLDNVKTICTGGSETDSLDDFKRKFVPIESIELDTVSVSFNTRNQLRLTDTVSQIPRQSTRAFLAGMGVPVGFSRYGLI